MHEWCARATAFCKTVSLIGQATQLPAAAHGAAMLTLWRLRIVGFVPARGDVVEQVYEVASHGAIHCLGMRDAK